MTFAELSKHFVYNPNSGKIYYSTELKARYNIRPGKEAGCVYSGGYWMVTYNKKRIKRSRLAFLLMTGDWPNKDVDHIDRNRLNDSWENLREASNSLNGFNRTFDSLKHRGIRYRPEQSKKNPWVVHIRKDGKLIHVGQYSTLEQAKVIRRDAELKFHGEVSSDF